MASLRRLLFLALLPLAMHACSGDESPPSSGSCASGDRSCLPPYLHGKSDSVDPCAQGGWYDDDKCDDGGYCAFPDPDCGPDSNACGDTDASEGMTWSGDAKEGCRLIGADDDIEVVLNEPYCDVCTAVDKNVLKARSKLVAKLVELIDGATTSVDLAQFTFSVAEIADALERAHARGVKVRLAMDSAQNQPGTRAQQLQAKGVEVSFVEGKPSGSNAGLQHAKFVLVDGRTLLTGSANYSSTGTTINEENAILLRGNSAHALIQGFSCHFEAMVQHNPDGAGACSNERVAFAPSGAPRSFIRDQLRAAKSSIDVIMHHFTFTDLVKELRNAAQRGVRVRVLVNATTRSEHQGGVWNELIAAGGRLRYKQVNEAEFQLMHHKLAIVDGRVLVSGSGNWSGTGFFNNFENYALYRQASVLRSYRSLFHRLWTWSLEAPFLDAMQDAATQHQATTKTYFGNLHAHFYAKQSDVALDDGKPERRDDAGQSVPVSIPGAVGDAARHAFEYARDVGKMDFMALSPHCRDGGEDPGDDANMSPEGYAAMSDAARAVSTPEFLALPSMEWSTNSAGNHIGIFGSRVIAKTDRGRFDSMYGQFLPSRDAQGDRPMFMLNHPKTFQSDPAVLAGSWDMVFGVNLLDIPKASERDKKFNDFGIDDYFPLAGQRDSWLRGEAVPDEAVVDETWRNLLKEAGPYARLAEVTLGRGTDLGSETPQNPSIVESFEQPGTFERRTHVRPDYEYFLSRGFHVAPAANHDNHFANWGSGHTSRTALIAAGLSEAQALDAIEQREVYASEDENLVLRVYAFGRVPMGGSIQSPDSSVPLRVYVEDPDYAGPFDVRIYAGSIGKREVTLVSELPGVGAGWQSVSLSLPDIGEHFFYVEVHATDVDREAWSAPIWVERI
ncbi:MAG: phospholipase D-like domain-containing protein [Polyangiaceae bacterium]